MKQSEEYDVFESYVHSQYPPGKTLHIKLLRLQYFQYVCLDLPRLLCIADRDTHVLRRVRFTLGLSNSPPD